MLENLFKLKSHNTTVKTEVVAGITTFMTMGYSWHFALTAVFIEGIIFIYRSF